MTLLSKSFDMATGKALACDEVVNGSGSCFIYLNPETRECVTLLILIKKDDRIHRGQNNLK